MAFMPDTAISHRDVPRLLLSSVPVMVTAGGGEGERKRKDAVRSVYERAEKA